MSPLRLLGVHNRRNALIARAILAALGVPEADDDAALREAAAGFEHLSSRLQPVGTIDGVTFVDDSLSTNVLPTLAALEAFEGRRVATGRGGYRGPVGATPGGGGGGRRGAACRALQSNAGRAVTSPRRCGPGSRGRGRTASCCCPPRRRAS